MSTPDLPNGVTLTIVRRWTCEECGAYGSVRKTGNRCKCGQQHETNDRHLQFTVSK